MKIYFPSHKNAENRGCEAITEGTANILMRERSQLIAFSQNPMQDEALGIGKYVTLTQAPSMNSISYFRRFLYRVQCRLILNQSKRKIFSSGGHYKNQLRVIGADDVALSTGGDMFCYGITEVIYINNYLHSKGVTTVLWGCSIGKENLTPEKLECLKRYAAITARESLTASMLRDELGLSNVFCFPDPAFVLEPETCPLPNCFDKQGCIGINLSNFVGGNVGADSIFGKNIRTLIRNILNTSNANIVLIPHVFWKGQDDRIVCNEIYNEFKDSNRVCRLDSEKINYCQIRYAISKCRFFIGARTHAVISAYSMCVPTLALGYSVKSRGIAKDIGLPENLVSDYRELKNENDLWSAFQYLIEHEDEIKTHLLKTMPDYRKRAYVAKGVVERLIEKQLNGEVGK